MIIVHRLGDFLFDLFPKAKSFGNSIEILKEELESYYSFGPYRPKVSISSDFVEILIDVPSIINQKPEFDKAIVFCEKRKFTEAKNILEKLIAQNPAVSEYHRVLGQIHSEEGNNEEAINCLIDALRWNPKNGHALIMMGNIYAKQKDDFDTALKYYNEAIAQNPDDFIAINNLGTNLIQIGKWEDGLRYLEAAYEINPNYPNTNYGIGLVNDHLGNTLVAFEYSVAALKKCGKNDHTIFNHALTLVIKVSEEWVNTGAGKRIFNEYKSHLEKESGKEIRVEVDASIPTAAKIEFAENYDRDYHIIRYKESYLAVEHLMMHELVHLDLSIQARKENSNMLFISGGDRKRLFIKDNASTIEKLNKDGHPEQSIADYIGALLEGMNRQILNSPVDLFIEDFLYETYPELRPYQFVSLYGLVSEGKNAVTDKRSVKLTPKGILSASKILNLVNAIHFKNLFGFDLIPKFESTPLELKEANRFYKEFEEYRKDREPGEEYELVQHWADDLKINRYFELVNEVEYRTKRTDMEGMISSLEKDPLNLESNQKIKEKEMGTFQKGQKELGVNMAVVMYMVDAMQHFKNLPMTKTKEIAEEIAWLGTQGIRPGGEQKYKLTNVSGKEFSGYHLLAYYYVSWSIAIPEAVKDLNLPYEKEYAMAKKMFVESGK